MKTLANILWLFIFGIWAALGWLFWAAFFAISIVGLPFARQCLKLARFTLWPFGRTAAKSPTARSLGGLGNVLWFIPGVFMAVGYAISGAFLCLTVIGIPFGLQVFKFIPLTISPFGKEIITFKEMNRRIEAGALALDDTIGAPIDPVAGNPKPLPPFVPDPPDPSAG